MCGCAAATPTPAGGRRAFSPRCSTVCAGRVRSGPMVLRADSGFYNRNVTEACRKADVSFSITVKLFKGLHKVIAAIEDKDWAPIPYWIDDGADVAETSYRPFFDKHPEVRLIIRRVKPTPGSQLALFATYDYHAFITDREGDMIELEADHRRHAIVEDVIRDLKYGVGLNHLPSGRFCANAAWMTLNVIAHNLGRWVNQIGLGAAAVPMTTKTIRTRLLSVPGSHDHLGRQEHPASSSRLAVGGELHDDARQPAFRSPAEHLPSQLSHG